MPHKIKKDKLPFMCSLIPRDNVALASNKFMFLVCGIKIKVPYSKTNAQIEHATSTQKGQNASLHLSDSTVPPCSRISNKLNYK